MLPAELGRKFLHLIAGDRGPEALGQEIVNAGDGYRDPAVETFVVPASPGRVLVEEAADVSAHQSSSHSAPVSSRW
ncbi:hypothetical protein [Kribbella sp. C-35]|uniref:hypothetical protein n=1 Tax=Kribbella sp. C-35 TaxID=2789276 RepID=UPI00397CF7D6